MKNVSYISFLCESHLIESFDSRDFIFIKKINVYNFFFIMGINRIIHDIFVNWSKFQKKKKRKNFLCSFKFDGKYKIVTMG